MQELYICMYHYVRDLEHSRYPNIKGMDSKLFEQQLHFFATNFNVITMEDVIGAVKDGYALPDKALLLTFDDGYADHYTTVFPLLSQYGMQGSFFVPGKVIENSSLLDVNKVHFTLASAPIDELVHDLKIMLAENRECYNLPSVDELWSTYAKKNRFDSADIVFAKRILQTGVPFPLRTKLSSILFEKYVGVSEESFAAELYINKNQMRVMKKNGMFFGIHGYEHYWLGNVPTEDGIRDINNALRAMVEFIDPTCWVMNYPYGNSSKDIIEYISGIGCVMGVSTEVTTAKIGVDNRFLLPRFDCVDFPPKSNNYENK